MGNCQNPNEINIGIRQHLQEQFHRVKKDQKRNYLTVSQVLEIKHPQDFPFDFKHLANLYVCDELLDGIFTISDFEKFITWIQNNMQLVQMYEFRSELQSRTVELMIEDLNKQGGETKIINWLLLEDNKKTKNVGQTYIKIQGIKVIYQVFNVKAMNDMDIQSFFYLIRRSSQDLGYPIEQVTQNDEDEEYISIAICQQFIKSFIKGMTKILKDVGYNNSGF